VNDEITYRTQRWRPPVRPDWVRRLNEEGACLDLRSVVPLDEESLISRAKVNTGLDDFGVDDWLEPFRVFIKALEEEAELTLMGRLMTRSDLLMNLEARLRIEDLYKRHPEIDEEEVKAPIWIIGSGRCGSSAMQIYLSLDPDSGTPKHWEALFPCPPPESATYHSDPRIEVAHQRMDQWNRVTPEIVSMHEFGGDIPTELIQLEALSFQSVGWLDLYGLVPTFDEYIERRSAVPAMSYAKRVLKLLQWKNPRKRWLLKSPGAMTHLPATFEVFPDVQMVWMHRDPLKSVSSFVSFVGTLFWIRSDRPLSEKAIARLTNPAGLAGLFNLVIDQLEEGAVPSQQFRHVQYVDFIKDPLGTIDSLYRDMGIPLTDVARQNMANYHREHPRDSRPTHKYSMGDDGRLAEERKLFERYQSYFKVKTENGAD
jgi:Sulfotransferase family